MAWTTPSTWGASASIASSGAGSMNEQVKDNLTFLSLVHGCRVWNAAAQSTSVSASTLMTWDSEGASGSGFDSDGYHSVSSNTSRLIVPTALQGTYLIVAEISWDGSVASTGYRYIMVRKNAAGSATGGTLLAQTYLAGVSGQDTSYMLTTLAPLVAADYVEVFTRQNGGTVAVQGGSAGSHFGMVWQGF